MSVSPIYAEEMWFRVLKRECEASTISEVAKALGYDRAAISLVLSGKYKAGTARVAAKVISTFTDYVQCPFVEESIPQPDCEDYQSRAMPTSDPQALRHWMKCRTGCPYSFHDIKEEGRNA